ncbi:ABC transporter ATP-binding protein [Paraburkholderia sartisoli]|uniref:Spermidine/putrescine import ATP-binding protein PotA n=1 Tax=Paraburkholderia sartisoli TaxID=83784 RepID=A0A1H4EZN1_9BURK|nr:ABC transporter ATP-binding protein [Paraburkholderia sartisoli]SEA90361.1 putative spermidine/putrescine transport system ATP-binding protein [Paraburkholderia sartisoli]
MNMIELKQVSRRYGAVEALAPLDFSVKQGEFVTLLGPSGSGKTTLLNVIAGMVSPSSGRIFMRGIDITDAAPSARGLGMVFQNYALMPHMTVFDNIAFPLRVRKMPKDEIRRKVKDVLDMVRLPDIAMRKPRELSGGQQQRVSLARCIVYNPVLILLDEPLGALDKKLREQMQFEIRRLHAQLGITMLNVTHDQDEALSMSDRIVLMNQGRVEQIATPDELYRSPRTAFAANFIGTANLISGTVQDSAGTNTVVSTSLGLLPATIDSGSVPRGTAVKLLVRPESVRMTAASDSPHVEDGAGKRHAGTLEDSITLGSVVRHHVRLPGDTQIVVQEQGSRRQVAHERGAPVLLDWAPEDCQIILQD